MWLLCRASCLSTISPQTPEVTARCADVRLKRSRKIGARPVSALNWFCDYCINWRNWNLWMWNKLFKRNVNLDPPLDLSRNFCALGQRWREKKTPSAIMFIWKLTAKKNDRFSALRKQVSESCLGQLRESFNFEGTLCPFNEKYVQNNCLNNPIAYLRENILKRA